MHQRKEDNINGKRNSPIGQTIAIAVCHAKLLCPLRACLLKSETKRVTRRALNAALVTKRFAGYPTLAVFRGTPIGDHLLEVRIRESRRRRQGGERDNCSTRHSYGLNRGTPAKFQDW
jgi:hypothetical protein